jgi:hypothetical protein
VFFDTYDNAAGRHYHQHPYISAGLNDGTMVYFHDGDGTHTTMNSDVGCSSRTLNRWNCFMCVAAVVKALGLSGPCCSVTMPLCTLLLL